jgi:hypothetical protein
MSVGMHTYTRIKKIEETANKLGFFFKEDSYGRGRDVFVLAVNSDVLPAYRHGSEMFFGSVEEIESFLSGITWARQYDLLVGLKTDQRREKAEKRLRNEQLIHMIKGKDNENI